jgi:hypothetical protein
MIGQGEILEIGSGGLSPVAQLHQNTVSIDISYKPGIVIVASASHLPLKNNSFDVVVALDTIEHLPRSIRNLAISEMIRVSREKVILSTPLENGKEFVGRQFDLLFNAWHSQRHGADEPSTSEHLLFIEPSPDELSSYGFKITPLHNATLWLNFMRLQHWLRSWRLARLTLLIAYLYHRLNRDKNNLTPFWGGICVLDKQELLTGELTSWGDVKREEA